MLKDFLILNTNSVMSFTRFASGEKFSLHFVFKHSYIEGITSDYDNFDYFLKLKVKNVANSRTFQDFQGPWQPCIEFFGKCKYICVRIGLCCIVCVICVFLRPLYATELVDSFLVSLKWSVSLFRTSVPSIISWRCNKCTDSCFRFFCCCCFFGFFLATFILFIGIVTKYITKTCLHYTFRTFTYNIITDRFEKYINNLKTGVTWIL